MENVEQQQESVPQQKPTVDQVVAVLKDLGGTFVLAAEIDGQIYFNRNGSIMSQLGLLKLGEELVVGGMFAPPPAKTDENAK